MIELGPNAMPLLYGTGSRQVGALPQRLSLLGDWIASVAHQPATLWWAANKQGLHPHICSRILHALERSPEKTTAEFREDWRLLIALAEIGSPPHESFPFYSLADVIKVDGWSDARVRKLGELHRPRLRVSRVLSSRRPPPPDESNRILQRELIFPDAAVLRDVPDEYLETYERSLSAAIDTACALINEFYYGFYLLGPIRQDDADPDNSSGSDNDLTALFRLWIATLDRLASIAPDVIGVLLGTWMRRPEPPFVRARIWAAGKEQVDPARAAQIFIDLDEDSFWDRNHQRDFLHSLAARWDAFPPARRSDIGQLLLDGPSPMKDEAVDNHKQRAAWLSLERIQWLLNRGCTFPFNAEQELARLRTIVPRWTPDQAHDADEAMVARGGVVEVETDPSELIGVPLAEIVKRAQEAEGRRSDFLLERRPFSGLAEKRPARALAALRRADFAESHWAWKSFLNIEFRKSDSVRLSRAIALALLALGADHLAEIVHHVARWFDSVYDRLATSGAEILDALWDIIIAAIQAHPELAGSAVLDSGDREPDWVLKAINAPAGILAELAIRESQPSDHLTEIDPKWLRRLTALNQLPKDLGLFALVLEMRYVSYLYTRAKAWSEQNLLGVRDRTESGHIAFWAGLFGAQTVSPKLLAALGSELPTLAAERRAGQGWNTGLARFLLHAWSHDDLRLEGVAIADANFREALLLGTEELRLQVLRVSQRWMQNSHDSWKSHAVALIEQVWPRQQAVRSQKISNAISLYIFAGQDLFPKLVAAGRDLVAPVGRDLMWFMDSEQAEQLVSKFPDALLDFLTAMLPEDAEFWPYRTEKVVEALGAGAYAHDPRLQVLRRRLSAR